MYIVLDSNIIIGAGYGNSAQFRLLLDTLDALQNTLCVPKVVLEEVVAHFGRTYDRDYQKAAAGIDKLSALLGKALPSPVGVIDKMSETISLRTRLEKQFESEYCAILDYPDTPHEDLARRATTRRKPYKPSGEGYRDSLIWETTLSLATNVDAQVVLLSENTKDFGDGDGNLHPQLIEDMVGRNLSEDKIILISSLSEFMDKHVTPALQQIEELFSDIEQLLSEPSIQEPVSLAIQDTYAGVEWNHDDLGLSWEYETLYLDIVENITNINLVDARKLPDGKSLMAIEADIDCIFDVFIFKADFFQIEDDPRLAVIDPDWNDHYFQAEIILALHANISLVLDNSDNGQPQFEVLSVEPILPEEERIVPTRRHQQLQIF